MALAFAMSAVMPVHTEREFVAALPRRPAPAELVVVSFVARGCRACRYSSAHLERVADEFDGERVRFLELDTDADGTQELCQQLGVSAVPSFHFYAFRGGEDGGVGCLDKIVGPMRVGRVRERVLEFSADGFDIEAYAFA